MKAYKVYGRDGHRQKMSFSPSATFDYGDRKITILNSDVTGTNDYSIVLVQADDCDHEIEAQISDGLFEGCSTGNVEIISISDAWGK